MRTAELPPMTAAESRVELAAATALFRSLADPTRLAIARRLAAGEARVVELTDELGIPQSTVSTHLACLRDCGLIEFQPRGRSSVYRLARPELVDLLTAAETVLEASGSAVVLCPVYGVGGAAVGVANDE